LREIAGNCVLLGAQAAELAVMCGLHGAQICRAIKLM
jgi:hypothetical protein